MGRGERTEGAPSIGRINGLLATIIRKKLPERVYTAEGGAMRRPRLAYIVAPSTHGANSSSP